MRGHRWADPTRAFDRRDATQGPESVGGAFELIEPRCSRALGDGRAYTIADPYLFTMAQWLEQDGVDPRGIPKVVEHRRRISERPSVGKAIAEELV